MTKGSVRQEIGEGKLDRNAWSGLWNCAAKEATCLSQRDGDGLSWLHE